MFIMGGGAPARDPYFSSVKLLCHFNGTNGSTTFTDVKGHTLTANGNVQISTVASKFGGASGAFDGTGDYVSAADSTDWDLGSGDFTIECFYNTSSTSSTRTLLGKWNSGGTKEWFLRQNGTSLEFFWTTDGSANNSVSVTWSMSTSTWYHVAVTRSGTSLKFWIDGVQQGATQTVSGTIYAGTSILQIGGINSGGDLYGYLDELRLTVGVARTITVPTSPYPDR